MIPDVSKKFSIAAHHRTCRRASNEDCKWRGCCEPDEHLESWQMTVSTRGSLPCYMASRWMKDELARDFKMCLCIAQETNLSSLLNRQKCVGFGGYLWIPSKRKRGYSEEILSKHTLVLRERNPVAIGVEQYVEDYVLQESLMRDNSHAPGLNRSVLSGWDMSTDVRTHESSVCKALTLSAQWPDTPQLLWRDVQHLAGPSSPPEDTRSLPGEPVPRNARCQRGGGKQTPRTINPAALGAVDIQGVEQQHLVLSILKAFELIRLHSTLPRQEIANYLSMAGVAQLLQGRGERIGRNYRRSAQNTPW